MFPQKFEFLRGLKQSKSNFKGTETVHIKNKKCARFYHKNSQLLSKAPRPTTFQTSMYPQRTIISGSLNKVEEYYTCIHLSVFQESISQTLTKEITQLKRKASLYRRQRPDLKLQTTSERYLRKATGSALTNWH